MIRDVRGNTMKKYFDITLPLGATFPSYPGDPAVKIEELREGIITISKIACSSHSGTHMDSPYHINRSGMAAYDVPFGRLIGTAKVFDMGNILVIDEQDIKGLDLLKGDTVLFKTRNSKILLCPEYVKDHCYLTRDAACLLSKIGVSAVGIDYFSVDAFDDATLPAHHELLSNNILLFEGLNLNNVESGAYEFIALPLLTTAKDAAPMRMVLIRE